MSALLNLEKSTILYILVAAGWAVSVAISPTLTEAACLVASLILAWYDYALGKALDLLRQVAEKS